MCYLKGRRSFAASSMFRLPAFVQLAGLLILTVGNSPIPAAEEQISTLRQRHSRLISSVQHYEARVAEQTAELSRMNRQQRHYDSDYAGDEDADEEGEDAVEDYPFNEEDVRREEEEVKELERKKRGLEERVSAMEQDINGVLR